MTALTLPILCKPVTTTPAVRAAVVVSTLCVTLTSAQGFAQISSGTANTPDAVATIERNLISQLEAERQKQDALIQNLEYKLEQLERRLSRIEKARELDDRQRSQASFEKRRTQNWPKVRSGMTRRQIYRLIGSGNRDKTNTAQDCRCYSQGSICFTSDDIAKKSNVRCTL